MYDNIETVEIYKAGSCARCGAHNGGCKRFRFVFHSTKSAYLCVACIQELGGAPQAQQWLERNAVFDQGKVVRFRHD